MIDYGGDMAEKEYIVIEEAATIIAELKNKYPKILWAVEPSSVVTLGITNKEPPEGKKQPRRMAQIQKISPIMRAVLFHHGIHVIYTIEINMVDWMGWGPARRQWILLHEVSHIPALNEGGLVKHDVEDFAFMIEAEGVDWAIKENLPDLIHGDTYKFNEALVTRLHMKDEYVLEENADKK